MIIAALIVTHSTLLNTFLRRIKRDMVERARTVESILTQYHDTVKPMHEAYIEPSKKYADIIIPRGGQNTSAIELLLSHIDSLLK